MQSTASYAVIKYGQCNLCNDLIWSVQPMQWSNMIGVKYSYSSYVKFSRMYKSRVEECIINNNQLNELIKLVTVTIVIHQSSVEWSSSMVVITWCSCCVTVCSYYQSTTIIAATAITLIVAEKTLSWFLIGRFCKKIFQCYKQTRSGLNN